MAGGIRKSVLIIGGGLFFCLLPWAATHLGESYAILLKLGRLDGICAVGLDLGQLLCAQGEAEKGMEILTRSRDGFRKLGWQEHAERAEKLIQSLSARKPNCRTRNGYF